MQRCRPHRLRLLPMPLLPDLPSWAGRANCACFTCGAGRAGPAPTAPASPAGPVGPVAPTAPASLQQGRSGRWLRLPLLQRGREPVDVFTCGASGQLRPLSPAGPVGRWRRPVTCGPVGSGQPPASPAGPVASRASGTDCACFTCRAPASAGPVRPVECACFSCRAGQRWAACFTLQDRSGRSPGPAFTDEAGRTRSVPEDPGLSAPAGPIGPLSPRSARTRRSGRSGRSHRARSVVAHHRIARAPASVRSDVPSCRSSPVDRSCRSSLLPICRKLRQFSLCRRQLCGETLRGKIPSVVRHCRRLRAHECCRSFQAQACLGSPNLYQQAHKPSAGA